MRPESRDPAALADMLRALGRIGSYLAGKTLADLQADEMMQDAVIRQFTVLGEAAARVSADTRALDPGIPWRAIVGLRNVVVHQYDDVDLGEIWRAVADQVPVVKARIDALLQAIQPDRGRAESPE